ncbi:hypothetical protein SCLCIDRAFT_736835 [Scleroderma citrinum Foug A]|uniref:Uncharacterized protein n=1 Tax=Scleroderma citrinum Foug A TaxID=1036808 RepID=A0A0C3AFI8_9AGAM|nr:hypothetical protein SCLCIDRAFT_736835 [Scleroderma citrinum Foug A]
MVDKEASLESDLRIVYIRSVLRNVVQSEYHCLKVYWTNRQSKQIHHRISSLGMSCYCMDGTSDSTDAALCPLSWFEETASFHGDIFRRGETFAMHLYIIAYYHHNIEECVSHAIRSYNGPVWIPLLAFEAVLALLAIWVGIKHSRQGPRSKSSRFSKPQLADSLIHGNVIYFVRFNWWHRLSSGLRQSPYPLVVALFFQSERRLILSI